MATVRSCLRAFFLRGTAGLGVRSLLSSLLVYGSLASFVLATAAANCDSIIAPPDSTGGTNNAAPGVPLCEIADPINCATGNLTETHVDLAVQGDGPPLRMVRTYNSQLAASQASPGPLGYGWTGSYSSKLTFSQEKTVATITHDNGSTVTFAFYSGIWNAPVWTQATFAQSGENYVYTQPDRSKLEFNGAGRLLKVTDRHNISLIMSYDGSGRLKTISDKWPLRQLTLTYNGSGQLEKVSDPMGRTVKYTYSAGNLASVIMPTSETPRWKFGYNGFHEMTSITNGRGYTTSTTFDGLHRATAQTDPLGRKYTFSYKKTGGVDETTITTPNGEVMLEKFNTAGSPTSITRAVGTSLEATSTYSYNGAYLVTSATDFNEHTTTSTYDAKGNKLTEKDPNGNETKWSYNSVNEAISETSPEGQVLTVTRNGAGDPTVIKRSFEAVTQEHKLEFNSFGDLLKHTDPVGRVRIYTYDGAGLGWLEAEYSTSATSENLLRKWKYNFNSEVIEEIDGRGFEAGNEEAAFATKITRDALGRPTIITDGMGGTTKTAYDANGNVESVTDSNGNATSYVYDSADQLVEVKRASGVTTKRTFTSLGQLASRTDGTGGTRELKYDILGQLSEIIDPLGRKTAMEYDDVGNLLKSTDAEGGSVSYTYDAGDRQTKVNYSGAATADVSLVYDKNSNLVEMTDGTGTSKQVLDPLDRPLEVVNGKGESLKYAFNAAGDVTKLTYPNGKSITRGFDSLGRLGSVVDWFGKETKFDYYRNSSLKRTTFPSETGNVDEFAYNPRGDVTQISMMKGVESLASFSYTPDKAGRTEKVIQKGFPGRPEEFVFGYDADNRLLKGNSTLFGYDSASNPTKVGSDTYTYDKAGQIATASNGTYVFNKLGQRTKGTPAGGPATSYAYDQAGNLTSVQRPAQGETVEINNTFKYDGFGLRSIETNGASTYPMVWDTTAGLPLLLRKGNDYYIYGPEGLPIAQIISNSTHYFHHDQQGSTRVLTSSSGGVIGTYEYSPYGVIVNRTGTQTTQIGYAGQYRSHASNLIYLRARTYDPATAQFLSVDPLVALSGEPYSYAENSPIQLGDPSGLYPGDCPCPPCEDERPPGPITQLPDVTATSGPAGRPRGPTVGFWPVTDWQDIREDALRDAIIGGVMGGIPGAILGGLKGAAGAYVEQVVIHNLGGKDSKLGKLAKAGFLVKDLVRVLPALKYSGLKALGDIGPSLRVPIVRSRIVGPLQSDVVPPWVRAGKRSPFRR